MLPDADGITAGLLRGEDDDADDDDDDIVTNDVDNDGDVIGNADGAMKKDDHYSENEKMEDENFGKMMSSSSTAVPSSAAGRGNNNGSSSSKSSIEELSPSSVPILRDYECEVSCINPRGRFLLRIYRHGIVLIDPKKIQDDCKIIVDSRRDCIIEHVIIFRKPEEYKKMKSGSGGGGGAGGGKKGLLAGGHMVLINLKEDDETLVGIEYKGKRLGQICFQLPSYGATAITAANDDDDDDKLIRLSPTESQWKAGLLSAFGRNNTINNNDNNNVAKIV